MLGIVFATAKEYAAALPHAEPPGEGAWSELSLCGRTVLAAVTGVGPLNAALTLGRLLGGATLSGVLNLGVAGSFDTAALPLRSVAVADAEIWPEYGLRSDTGVDPRGIGFPLARTPGGPIHERIGLAPTQAAKALSLSLSADWITGPSLTVSAASGTPTVAAAHHKRHAPLTENMEGFALALGCLAPGLPFLEVRVVSNQVGSRDKAHWDLAGALEKLPTVLDVLFQS